MAASLVTASNINGEFEFSEYCKSLDELRMARYKEKVSICGFDPYQLKMTDYSNDLSLLPGIEYPDIIMYLALECSFLTMKEMKTFKSTEAYNMFILELVGTVYTKKIAGVDKVAVFAMVNQTEAGQEPFRTWIVGQMDGQIVTAHCTCIVGLSRACSHIGALLYAIETGVRIRESTTHTTHTEEVPPCLHKMLYKRISEIDFGVEEENYSSESDDDSDYQFDVDEITPPTKEE